MDGIQITEPNKISAITKKENFDSIDSAKVMITKALFLREDFNTYLGDDRVNYPIIPARIGIGKVTETSDGGASGFQRGMRVFPHPVSPCGKCFECDKGNLSGCAAFNVAGKTADGFLRDFVVVNTDYISELPTSVSDNNALFIDHIALGINVIDAIKLQKGEHVIIVGGDIIGIILAQLVMYYQGIPILVDNNEKNIELAEKAGVYYALYSDNKVEKSVADLTGARFSTKVVYSTGSNLNTDIALRLSGQNATVCFAGFGTPNLKVNFNVALQRQLKFNCITNGVGNVNSAINLLANKAIDTSIFTIPTVKQNEAMAVIQEMSKDMKFDACSGMLIVDIS